MPDTVKKSPNVALEHPDVPAIIRAGLSEEPCHPLTTCVRSLPHARGVGVEDERTLEHRLDHLYDGLVDNPIPHARLVDPTPFRIVDNELFIRAVHVRSAPQLCMQREEMILDVQGELCDLVLRHLPNSKPLPRTNEILYGSHLIKNRMTSSSPPPNAV